LKCPIKAYCAVGRVILLQTVLGIDRTNAVDDVVIVVLRTLVENARPAGKLLVIVVEAILAVCGVELYTAMRNIIGVAELSNSVYRIVTLDAHFTKCCI